MDASTSLSICALFRPRRGMAQYHPPRLAPHVTTMENSCKVICHANPGHQTSTAERTTFYDDEDLLPEPHILLRSFAIPAPLHLSDVPYIYILCFVLRYTNFFSVPHVLVLSLFMHTYSRRIVSLDHNKLAILYYHTLKRLSWRIVPFSVVSLIWDVQTLSWQTRNRTKEPSTIGRSPPPPLHNPSSRVYLTLISSSLRAIPRFY